MYHTMTVLLCSLLLIIPGVLCSEAVEEILHEEHSTVKMPCKVLSLADKNFWYKGYCKACSDEMFSKYKDEEPVKYPDEVRDGIDIYHNFTLVIDDVLLSDEDTYTCRAETRVTSYSYTNLSLYIQPTEEKIHIGGLDGDLVEGNSVTASCTIKRLYPKIASTGLFNMTWGEKTKREYDASPVVGDKAFKYTVTWTRVLSNSDHETTVTCNLTPEIGYAVSKDKTIQVKYKPYGEPTIEASNEYPIPWDKVTFNCHHEGVTANPYVSKTEWIKDAVVIGTGKEYFTYEIQHVNATHNGSYTCRVGNTLGFGDHIADPIELSVNYSAFYAPRGEPELTVDNQSPVEEVSSVTFKCSTANIDSCLPINSLIWTKDDQPFPIWVNQTSPTISNVQREDSGNYSCSIGNIIGYSSPSNATYLDVLYAPEGQIKLSIDNLEPRAGDEVSFRCDIIDIDSNPQVYTVIWYKDNRVLQWPAQNLTHTNTMLPGDEGGYSCCLQNIAGYSPQSAPVQIHVFYAPLGRPNASVEDQNPVEGQIVTFSCRTEDIASYPSVNLVNWTKDGAPLTDWPSDAFNHTITVSPNDTGNYTCHVANDFGSTNESDSVNFDVLYGPKGEPVLEINVTEEIDVNEYVTFTCIKEGIISNPELTIVKWTKDGQDLSWPDTPFTHTIKVATADDGEYCCRVGNIIKGNPTYSGDSDPKLLQVKGSGGDGGGGGGGGSPPTAAVVGGVVGALALIALVAVILVFVLRKRRNAKHDENSSGNAMVGLSPSRSGSGYVEQGAAANNLYDNGEAQYDEVAVKPKPAPKPHIKPKPQHHAEAVGGTPTTYSSVGDLYGKVDKSKKTPEQPAMLYAELDLHNKVTPTPAPRSTKPTFATDDPPTDYAEVDWKKTRERQL